MRTWAGIRWRRLVAAGVLVGPVLAHDVPTHPGPRLACVQDPGEEPFDVRTRLS